MTTDRYRPPDRRSPSPRHHGPASSAYRPSYDREHAGNDCLSSRLPGAGAANNTHALPPRPPTASDNRDGNYDPRKPRSPPHSSSYRQQQSSNGSLPPMRRFGQPHDGGDRYLPPAQSEFSFRVGDRDGPRYPAHPQDRRQPRPPPPRGPRGQRGHGGQRGRGGRPFNRPFRPKVATAERPLLRFGGRGSTPEQLEGMNADNAAATYRNVDDMSDSDAQSMDQSENEDALSAAGVDEALGEAKRVKTEPPLGTNGDEAPKWSNPELYTALPPVEDAAERKRRDVVKLIRKARVAALKDSSEAKPLGGDDFISFGFDEESDSADSYEPPVTAPDQVASNSATTLDVESTAQVSLLAIENSVASRFSVEGLKRKREDSDEGRRLLAPRTKVGRGARVDGHVLADWSERAGLDPTPWIKHDHSKTALSGFRLHKEICDFFEFVKPKPFEQQMRQDLLVQLQVFIDEVSGGTCAVHAFGSFAAGLYLPNADMDVVVVSKRYMNTGAKDFAQSRTEMWRLARRLRERGLATDQSLEVISGAKVPIIKFVHPRTRLNVDMSFENTTGITANSTFQQWKAEFPAMPILVTLIKQFLMMRGLNNVANGGIGGFSVTCLVVSLLQNLPRVQMGELRPEAHLGETLLEFLDFYGNQLDITRTALRMNPPGFIEKSQVPYLRLNDPNKRGRLCIIDPNRADNDISGGSKEIGLIFQRFSIARQQLLAVMQHAEEHGSLLRCFVGGNYNDFHWYRWQLRTIYEQQHGPVPAALDDYIFEETPVDVARNETQQVVATAATNKISAKPASTPAPTKARPTKSPKNVRQKVQTVLSFNGASTTTANLTFTNPHTQSSGSSVRDAITVD